MDWREAEPVFQAAYRLLNEHEQTSMEAVCNALGHPAGHDATVLALEWLYESGLIGGLMFQNSPAPLLIDPTPAGQEIANR